MLVLSLKLCNVAVFISCLLYKVLEKDPLELKLRGKVPDFTQGGGGVEGGEGLIQLFSLLKGP